MFSYQNMYFFNMLCFECRSCTDTESKNIPTGIASTLPLSLQRQSLLNVWGSRVFFFPLISFQRCSGHFVKCVSFCLTLMIPFTNYLHPCTTSGNLFYTCISHMYEVLHSSIVCNSRKLETT